MVDTPELIQCGKHKYTPEVLEKKRQLAMKALSVAMENRKKREALKTPPALAPLPTPKPAKAPAKKAPAPAPPPPAPELEPEPEPELPPMSLPPSTYEPETPIKKPKAKAKATPVYESSTEEESSDGDDYVLVKKKTVKKYRQMKRENRPAPAPKKQTPVATHEISEKALADRWASERYKLMLSSMFPNHAF